MPSPDVRITSGHDTASRLGTSRSRLGMAQDASHLYPMVRRRARGSFHAGGGLRVSASLGNTRPATCRRSHFGLSPRHDVTIGEIGARLTFLQVGRLDAPNAVTVDILGQIQPVMTQRVVAKNVALH